ncbi:MAG: DUF5615 family PIN-like protein [Deltaproteobacteria bacterium]|nr:DUF5615 family PIN-like protein [Deltaproteobacteria bacterium]
MIIWIDAQLSPALASWIPTNFGIDCQPVRELGLLGAKDRQIFQAARDAAVNMSTSSVILGIRRRRETDSERNSM